mmetsp:Transcript_30434/g.98914  ORF Transcript_30434/g.98914 Transcript_30434/m.98914 type:complete len:342 (+) Transcript_30434:1457-2482(+)
MSSSRLFHEPPFLHDVLLLLRVVVLHGFLATALLGTGALLCFSTSLPHSLLLLPIRKGFCFRLGVLQRLNPSACSPRLETHPARLAIGEHLVHLCDAHLWPLASACCSLEEFVLFHESECLLVRRGRHDDFRLIQTHRPEQHDEVIRFEPRERPVLNDAVHNLPTQGFGLGRLKRALLCNITRRSDRSTLCQSLLPVITALRIVIHAHRDEDGAPWTQHVDQCLKTRLNGAALFSPEPKLFVRATSSPLALNGDARRPHLAESEHDEVLSNAFLHQSHQPSRPKIRAANGIAAEPPLKHNDKLRDAFLADGVEAIHESRITEKHDRLAHAVIVLGKSEVRQ